MVRCYAGVLGGKSRIGNDDFHTTPGANALLRELGIFVGKTASMHTLADEKGLRTLHGCAKRIRIAPPKIKGGLQRSLIRVVERSRRNSL